MGVTIRKKDEIELSVLKRFGLRIAILEAWVDRLREKGIDVPETVSKTLAKARVKISSGCFTACDVGCDLGKAEALLTTTTATSDSETPDYWLDLLGECQSQKTDVDEFVKWIKYPKVELYLNRFNFDCRCGECE